MAEAMPWLRSSGRLHTIQSVPPDRPAGMLPLPLALHRHTGLAAFVYPRWLRGYQAIPWSHHMPLHASALPITSHRHQRQKKGCASLAPPHLDGHPSSRRSRSSRPCCTTSSGTASTSTTERNSGAEPQESPGGAPCARSTSSVHVVCVWYGVVWLWGQEAEHVLARFSMLLPPAATPGGRPAALGRARAMRMAASPRPGRLGQYWICVGRRACRAWAKASEAVHRYEHAGACTMRVEGRPRAAGRACRN